MTTTFGVDVSQYQSAGFPVRSLREQGYEFLTARCSVGLETDLEYARFVAEAAEERMLFAAYHYLTPESIDEQVAVIKHSMGHGYQWMPLMVDFEEGEYMNLLRFLGAARAAGLNVKSLYYPRWFWERTGEPHMPTDLQLVSSMYGANKSGYGYNEYPGNTSVEWAAYGGHIPLILQFGSRIEITGYSGYVDADAARYDRAVLSRTGCFHDFNPTTAEKLAVKSAPPVAHAPVVDPAPVPPTDPPVVQHPNPAPVVAPDPVPDPAPSVAPHYHPEIREEVQRGFTDLQAVVNNAFFSEAEKLIDESITGAKAKVIEADVQRGLQALLAGASVVVGAGFLTESRDVLVATAVQGFVVFLVALFGKGKPNP